MEIAHGKKRVNSTYVLSGRGEEILKAIHFYRYMTLLDVTYLLYSPKSLNYVGSMLSALCGNADFKTNEYLYRFKLPSGGGNTKRIYTLGSRGRDFLASEVGLPVSWYYRPEKVRHMSYGQMMHNLVLTRFLVAASAWARRSGEFKIAEMRTCYELDIGVAKVVPDAWILFEKVGKSPAPGGSRGNMFPVLLEIDRGTEYKRKFKEHVAGRIEFIKSGAYEKIFGTKAVIIAYVTTAESSEGGEVRRRSMCSWTQEVLKEQRKESWASVFHFMSCMLDDMYTSGKLDGKVWYRPDSDTPTGLF